MTGVVAQDMAAAMVATDRVSQAYSQNLSVLECISHHGGEQCSGLCEGMVAEWHHGI